MKKINFAVAAFLCQLLITAPAAAGGIGVYTLQGSGDADWEYTYDYLSLSEPFSTFSTDVERSGYGIFFDTAVARDRLFNYRIGLEKSVVDYGPEFDEISIVQDFGFGIMRSPSVRLWIGPELRITDQRHDGGWRFSGAGVGLGLAAGLHWNMGNVLTLAAKGGVIKTAYLGEVEASYDDFDYEIDQTESFVSLGVVFRTNDRFYRK